MNISKMNNKNLEFLDLVSLGSAGLGIYNTILNKEQISNNELFKELQKQDDILSNQILDKLKTVEFQNQEILKLLKKGDSYE